MGENIQSNYSVYQLREGDIFVLSADLFFSNSTLWTKPYQILGTYKQRLKKKILWFHIPELHETTIVKIMYIGEGK